MASESKNDTNKSQTQSTPADATKAQKRELSDAQLSGIAGGGGEGPPGVFPIKESGSDEAIMPMP